MKVRSYTYHHRHGPAESRQGTVHDIICEYQYLVDDCYVVPKIVVNSILETGGVSPKGMFGDCTWKPFSINQAEYEQLVELFIENDFDVLEVPSWVVDGKTWQILLFEIDLGMPHEAQLDIDVKTRKAEAELDKARRDGDENREGKYMMELVHLSAEWNALFNRYKDR